MPLIAPDMVVSQPAPVPRELRADRQTGRRDTEALAHLLADVRPDGALFLVGERQVIQLLLRVGNLLRAPHGAREAAELRLRGRANREHRQHER